MRTTTRDQCRCLQRGSSPVSCPSSIPRAPSSARSFSVSNTPCPLVATDSNHRLALLLQMLRQIFQAQHLRQVAPCSIAARTESSRIPGCALSGVLAGCPASRSLRPAALPGNPRQTPRRQHLSGSASGSLRKTPAQHRIQVKRRLNPAHRPKSVAENSKNSVRPSPWPATSIFPFRFWPVWS